MHSNCVLPRAGRSLLSSIPALSLLLLAAGYCSTALADPTARDAAPAIPPIELAATQDVAAGADAPELEEIVIVYPPPARRTTPLPAAVFESGRARNVSEALREIPGLDGVKRGASGLEPVVRGLGWERVPVMVQGLPIQGAGPGRMDTPATLFGASAVQSVEVIKGLPSVTLGPGGTGGHILVDTDYERPAGSGTEFEAGGRGSYQSQGDAFVGTGYARGGSEYLDAYLGIDGHRAGDYESGDGVKVPANARTVGGALSLGFRPAEGHRANAGFIDSEYWNVDFPSLPLDSDDGSARILDAGYRLERDEGAFTGLNLRSGYARVRHAMSNRRRASWQMMQMELDGLADTVHAGLDGSFGLPAGIALEAGVDFNHLKRDAARNRKRVMNGMSARDRVWPDIWQWNVGLFVEGEAELVEDVTLRVGARLDQAESGARAADDEGFGAMAMPNRPTVRERFVQFYGPAAAETNRSWTMGGGNVLIEWAPIESVELHVGGGVVSRAPALSELYFAFAPAPGGYQLGNPTLAAEKRYEIEAGVSWRSDHVDISLQVYHRWIGDYILSTILNSAQNIDGMPGNDIVRGFRNVDATLYGSEANITFRFLRYLSLPVTLAYVRGRNESDGGDLPEIPPFEARLALRAEAGQRFPFFAEFGARLVAQQDHIDASFGEDATPGFQTLHLRTGVEVVEGLQIDFGIENLLNEAYNEHLTREVPAAVGGLMPGDEVPEPGRSYSLTLRYAF